jgi:hypothetical protein
VGMDGYLKVWDLDKLPLSTREARGRVLGGPGGSDGSQIVGDRQSGDGWKVGAVCCNGCNDGCDCCVDAKAASGCRQKVYTEHALPFGAGNGEEGDAERDQDCNEEGAGAHRLRTARGARGVGAVGGWGQKRMWGGMDGGLEKGGSGEGGDVAVRKGVTAFVVAGKVGVVCTGGSVGVVRVWGMQSLNSKYQTPNPKPQTPNPIP